MCLAKGILAMLYCEWAHVADLCTCRFGMDFFTEGHYIILNEVQRPSLILVTHYLSLQCKDWHMFVHKERSM